MMGNYEQLKAAVASIVRDNGAEEITGNVLQSVLISIINSVGSGAVFAGIATPSTSPSNPDPNMFYIAVEAGIYPNFNLTVTTGMCIFSNESGTWVGHELGVSSQFESGEYITEVSITDTLEGAETDNLPTVGAVNGAVTALNTAIATERQDRQEADGNQTVALNLEKTLRQQGDEANAASVGYYVCDTAAATAVKVVDASGYVLRIGGNMRIQMTNANTAANATLNINGTGAKALFYNGAQASSDNSWEAGDVIEVYYDGVNYATMKQGGGTVVEIDTSLTKSGAAADARTVGEIVGLSTEVGDEIPVTPITGAAITNTNTVRSVSGFSYVKDLDVSAYAGVRVRCQPAGWSCLLAMDSNYTIKQTYTNISRLTDFDFNVIGDGIKYLSISSQTTITVTELIYEAGAIVEKAAMEADATYKVVLTDMQTTYTANKYLNRGGGTQNYTGANVSAFIEIPAGVTSFLYKGHWLGESVNAAFWGDDLTTTAFAYARVNPTSDEFQLIEIPTGATHMKVSSIDSVPEIVSSLSGMMSVMMSRLTNFQSNRLYGKTIVGLGDSEMAGQGRTPTCKLIANRNSMTFYNHGVGGQHITTTASDTILGLIESNADFIIVQVGYNDTPSISYLNDETTDDSTDASTFKGAFNHIVEYVQTNHPSARLGFILPRYYEDDSTGQSHENHYAVAMWMGKRARTLHIPFFDETANSGMSYSIAEQRALYFQDYVHLSDAGFERVSYPVEEWLRGV